jgi:serine/threonine protein kinase
LTGIVVNQVSQDINNAEPTILLGDMFKGFQFLHELGHGAFGRVFIAKQEGLAGRFVALKVSRDAISESQHLARLQHTNIVPIYLYIVLVSYTPYVCPISVAPL